MKSMRHRSFMDKQRANCRYSRWLKDPSFACLIYVRNEYCWPRTATLISEDGHTRNWWIISLDSDVKPLRLSAAVESGNRKTLGNSVLEQLLNQIGESFNQMKRHCDLKMVVRCKRRYRPKFKRWITNTWERQHMIALGLIWIKKQDLQNQNSWILRNLRK